MLCRCSLCRGCRNASPLRRQAHFFFHTPCPLSLSEREGVPPHTRPFTFVNGANAILAPHPDPPLEGRGRGGNLVTMYKTEKCTALPYIRNSPRSCYFQTPFPLSPFPHGKGERIAPASSSMRAQTARFARERKYQKNSCRSFSVFRSDRRRRSWTAPYQRTEVRESDVRIKSNNATPLHSPTQKRQSLCPAAKSYPTAA